MTSTTILVPVYFTEFRESVVLQAGPASIIVRDQDGVRKRFSQDQLDKWGIQILKDGRLMRIGEVKEGDVLTAKIVSPVAPVAVTEQDVKATLDKAAPKVAKAETGTPAAPAPGAAAPTAAPGAAPTLPAPARLRPAPPNCRRPLRLHQARNRPLRDPAWG